MHVKRDVACQKCGEPTTRWELATGSWCEDCDNARPKNQAIFMRSLRTDIKNVLRLQRRIASIEDKMERLALCSDDVRRWHAYRTVRDNDRRALETELRCAGRSAVLGRITLEAIGGEEQA